MAGKILGHWNGVALVEKPQKDGHLILSRRQLQNISSAPRSLFPVDGQNTPSTSLTSHFPLPSNGKIESIRLLHVKDGIEAAQIQLSSDESSIIALGTGLLLEGVMRKETSGVRTDEVGFRLGLGGVRHYMREILCGWNFDAEHFDLFIKDGATLGRWMVQPKERANKDVDTIKFLLLPTMVYLNIRAPTIFGVVFSQGDSVSVCSFREDMDLKQMGFKSNPAKNWLSLALAGIEKLWNQAKVTGKE